MGACTPFKTSLDISSAILWDQEMPTTVGRRLALALVLVSPGCGLVAEPGFHEDSGPSTGVDARLASQDAALDAVTVDAAMDARPHDAAMSSLDAPLDEDAQADAGEFDAPVSMDATPFHEVGGDAYRDTPSALTRDAAGDVGTDAWVRPSFCGNGIVEGRESCDIGPASLLAAAVACSNCTVAVGCSSATVVSPLAVALSTEAGAGTTSAWQWSAGPVGTDDWVAAVTTDEATCVSGYLHGREGVPGFDGWVSASPTGCGSPMGAPPLQVRYRRSFVVPVRTEFTIAIGADDRLSTSDGSGTMAPQVFLDGIRVTTVAAIPGAERYWPQWTATMAASPTVRHVLTIVVVEDNGFDAALNNNGIYVNGWAPSQCLLSSP